MIANPYFPDALAAEVVVPPDAYGVGTGGQSLEALEVETQDALALTGVRKGDAPAAEVTAPSPMGRDDGTGTSLGQRTRPVRDCYPTSWTPGPRRGRRFRRFSGRS